MRLLQSIESEVWLPVPGFDLYQVSNLGRFKRNGISATFEIEGKVDRLGYRQIGLQKNGRQVWMLAHRLVAATFLSPDQIKAENGQFLTVNHKDRNKLNNRVDNLELVSVAENHRHYRKHPLQKMVGATVNNAYKIEHPALGVAGGQAIPSVAK